MLMFVWGLKLEKILKADGSPSMYLVFSVLFVVPATNRAPVPEKKEIYYLDPLDSKINISYQCSKTPKNINTVPSLQKKNQ